MAGRVRPSDRRRRPFVHRRERGTGNQRRDSNKRSAAAAHGLVAVYLDLRSVAFHFVFAPPLVSSATGADNPGDGVPFALNNFSVITKKNIGIRNGARNGSVTTQPIPPLPPRA